jgi:hypothetical protein
MIQYAIAWARKQFLYKKIGFQICGKEFVPSRFVHPHYPLLLTWELLKYPKRFSYLKLHQNRDEKASTL